jgi:spore coat protein A, manganese oxidase
MMNIKKKKVLRSSTAAVLGMALLLGGGIFSAQAFYNTPPGLTTLFTQPFRGGDAPSLLNDIGVAAPDGTTAPVTGVTHYTINIEEFTDTLHTGLGGVTTLWGYVPNNYLTVPPSIPGPLTPKHLGGIIVAQKDVPIQITFQNMLTANKTSGGTPLLSPIPVDPSIYGANVQQNRTAVHLHGGFIPWISDGGPFDWFDAAGNHGLSFINNRVLNPSATDGQAEYYYGNHQSARMMWYHDHAVGITRTNAYAGVATGYIIRDDYEAGLGLPRIEGGTNPITTTALSQAEIPIVVQDKIFVGANIGAVDPTWLTIGLPLATANPGSLWYAHVYDKALYKIGPNIKKNTVTQNPSVVPEFFGDTMLANGQVYPIVNVEPKKYRIRFLNACNARFLNLQLLVHDGTADGITLNKKTGLPTNLKGPDWLVIGTEGGFLPKATTVAGNLPFNPVTLGGSLITAPAERWDLIVDFSTFSNKKIVLYNDAPAPFPVGDPRNDYFPGWNMNANPVNATSIAGSGPNTREIMVFNVGPSVGTDLGYTGTISSGYDLSAGNDPLTLSPTGATPRSLTLNENFDLQGRLLQQIGTNVPLVAGTFGRAYIDAPTETPVAGTTEVWSVANLTGDTHPLHFHLVNVQILDRTPFKVNKYTGAPTFTGPAVPPLPEDAGWKETVKMNPGEVTRVIMKFVLPTITGPLGTGPNKEVDFTTVTNGLTPPQPGGPTNNYGVGGLGTPPPSPRTGGNEYVWHCHILEHEEHDMMRPLIVN